jgi:hypothetical protein
MIELQAGRRNLNDAWRFKLQLVHKEILLSIGKRGMSLGGEKSPKEGLSIIDKPSQEYKQTEFCEPAPVELPVEKHNTRDTIGG